MALSSVRHALVVLTRRMGRVATINMKTIALIALVLATAAPVARSAQPPPPDSATELVALAQGYVQAFERLYQSRTISLSYERNGRTYTLRDVRKIEALGGVLVVTTGSGSEKYLLNPRDVVVVTDSARLPPAEH